MDQVGDAPGVRETLAYLTPHEVPGFTRRRFGSQRWDGGYVLLEELLTDQPIISAGIGRQITFDTEMADRGHDIHMFDHTIMAPPGRHRHFHFQRLGIAPPGQGGEEMISIDAILASLPEARSDIVLKMDIEGAEWPVLQALPAALLRRFSMIALELHGLASIGDAAERAIRHDVLGKLAADFSLFHVHANNVVGTRTVHGMRVHPLLEVSYVRSDLVRPAPNRTVYPAAIDPPNVAANPEVPLWFFPFLPVNAPTEHLNAEMSRCAAQLDAAARRAEEVRATRAAGSAPQRPSSAPMAG